MNRSRTTVLGVLALAYLAGLLRNAAAIQAHPAVQVAGSALVAQIRSARAAR